LTDKLTSLRDDVYEIIDKAGATYTVTHYTISSEDVWGRNKTANVTTENLFIIQKIEGEKLRREGQKEIGYYIVLANYNSVLEIGDKVTIDSKDCWVRTIQPAHYQGEVFAKRIAIVVEEWR